METEAIVGETDHPGKIVLARKLPATQPTDHFFSYYRTWPQHKDIKGLYLSQNKRLLMIIDINLLLSILK